MGGKALLLALLLVGGSQPSPTPGREEVDEIMQIFLERSPGRHLAFEPINIDDLDPLC